VGETLESTCQREAARASRAERRPISAPRRFVAVRDASSTPATARRGAIAHARAAALALPMRAGAKRVAGIAPPRNSR